MYFYHPQDRDVKELFPAIRARTFWGENMLLAVVDLDGGSLLPNHNHPHEQGGIVIKGELEFTIAGETRLLRPGDVYIIPGNVEHSVKVGEQDAQVMDIFTPAREDLKY